MLLQKTARAQTLSRWSFWLTLFVTLVAVFAPSNLFYSFDQFNWAVRGLRIDYLLPKLYLTDLLLLGVFCSSFSLKNFKQFGHQGFEKILILASTVLLFRQFFTAFPITAVVQFWRLTLLIGTAYNLSKTSTQIRMIWVWFGLFLSNFLEGLLSIWQFVTQHSLGSYRTLFGEPNLSQSFGLAHGTFGSWGELILPYGTTAHPNILAAWLVSSWLLLMVWSAKITLAKPVKAVLLVLSGMMAIWGILVTQSITALGLFLHGIVYLFAAHRFSNTSQKLLRNCSIGLVFCIMLSPWIMQWTMPLFSKNFTEQPSITRRVFLQAASQTMLLQNPLWGVGLNQFTAHLESANQLREPVRFDQPVHHVFWLWLTETGLMGMGALMGATWYLVKQKPQRLLTLTALLWLLFPSLIWDHYLATQPTGLLIVWLWWASLRNEG